MPSEADALQQIRELASRRGGDQIAWRYDPLLFWREDGEEHGTWDPQFFARMCEALGTAGVRTCYTSLADHYRKFVWRLRRNFPSVDLREPSDGELDEIAGTMRSIASTHGMTVNACTEPRLIERFGFPRGSCINGALFDASTAAAHDQNLKGRETCDCTLHRDIGDYVEQECGYSCVYCYANPNHRRFSVVSS